MVSTVTLPSGQPGDPTTVEIRTPSERVAPVSTTVPITDGGTTISTVTIPPGQPGDPTTVEVRTPSASPAVTTTETPPPTSASTTPTPTCDNGGIEYAVWDSPFFGSNWANYELDYFKSNDPYFEGVTERVGFSPGWGPLVVYDDSPEVVMNTAAINHRGFIYGVVGGDYIVTMSLADDIAQLWVGDKAVTDWTDDNDDVYQRWPDNGLIETTVSIEQGSYAPFRVFWINREDPYSLDVTVVAPDGTVVFDMTRSDPAYIKRFACDGSTPEWPPWNQNGGTTIP